MQLPLAHWSEAVHCDPAAEPVQFPVPSQIPPVHELSQQAAFVQKPLEHSAKYVHVAPRGFLNTQLPEELQYRSVSQSAFAAQLVWHAPLPLQW